MIFCQKCRREMKVDKNGVGVDFGNGHVYCSDRYICLGCGATVLHALGASFDPHHELQNEYIDFNPVISNEGL